MGKRLRFATDRLAAEERDARIETPRASWRVCYYLPVSGTLRAGTAVAGFRILSLVGEGSSGTVYLAEDVSLERRVALKVLAPELARDERFRERFLRESRLAASLDHPHIVPIHAAGEAAGVLYLAMRYVEGRDLRALLETHGRLAPERAVLIVSQVASALDAAHEKGLIHRDVKPGNVLVGSVGNEDHAYLCDFGLAKHLSGAASLTRERAFAGTIDYIAPEQIEGAEVDLRTDVYALGCVLFECLAGAPPFERENDVATLHAHLAMPPPRLSESQPELPEALDDVIAGALAKDPSARYQSCGELAAAGRAAVRGHEPALPPGVRAAEPAVRTFVFADIRGYTRFTRERGDEAAGRLAADFAELVSKVVRERGGALQELRGDEALLVFDSARDALRCAVELQRRFAEERFELGAGMGLDAGEAIPVAGGFRGGALNLASRLCAQAGPGEILASQAVVHLAARLEGIAYTAPRLLRLKGYAEPVGAVEVVAGERAPRGLKRTLRRVPELLLPPQLLRHPGRLMLAGALLVAGAVTAAVLQLTGDGVQLAADGSSALAVPSPNAVIEFDPRNNEPVRQILVGSNPTALAVGEEAVWLLNTDDQTISRIDLESKRPKTFGSGTTPVDLAAGAGSVWIGNATVSPTAEVPLPVLSSVSQVDPDTFGVQGTSELDSEGTGGYPDDSLAVGKDAVWVINPDRTVSRIDPGTGELVATVRSISVDNIAVGPTGIVWAISYTPDVAVVRIDPRSNRLTARITIPSRDLSDIAVGADSVWVSSAEDGTVWRVEPGPPVRQRTVPVSRGVDKLAFGEGAVWVVNPVRGTLSRIDPSTNLVSRTIEIQGTPRDVAVGEERIWVSNAGASCGKVIYGGEGDPDFLVVSDLPLRNAPAVPALAMSEAIEHVFRERGFRAGKYRVAYQSCDDSTAGPEPFDVPKCLANAKSYALGASVLGVIGPWNSGCAFNQIPLLNEAPGGPLAMVSPSNSYVGLTRPDPFAPREQLASLYPTGKRNYARVLPPDDALAAGAALFIKGLGIERAYLLIDSASGDGYGGLHARSFRSAARETGLEVVGSARWDPGAKRYTALVEGVRRSGADAVFLVGFLADNLGQLLRELRAGLGPRTTLLTSDGFLSIADLFRATGPTARSVYVAYLGFTNEQLPSAGRRFVDSFAATQRRGEVVHPTAAHAAQAAEVLLAAIARSDGTRASVTKELFATQVQDGILGTFGFDRNGDTTAPRVTILQPRRGGGSHIIGSVDGASVVRVIEVPPSLLH
jgi:class 3 adenylate cyclase/ABC-type branched-subunit amino acid transport system substrate-binding protein/tRNA A-37 threonylcarbamoyl transferase component Bud32